MKTVRLVIWVDTEDENADAVSEIVAAAMQEALDYIQTEGEEIIGEVDANIETDEKQV